MKSRFPIITIMAAAAIMLSVQGCGETRTSGFYVGHITTQTTSRDTTTVQSTPTIYETSPQPNDTLLNCTFDDVLTEPFGSSCRYEVYHGSMHIDNSAFQDPVVLLSTAGLLDDGLVEAQFDLVDAPAHCVVGLVLGAESTGDFILIGANSRGQYTVQRCINGLWLSVMGMEPFESSRLLPYSLPGVEISALVHGNYIDFRVNGQLIQVVRTTMPALGQVGVFVDGYVDASLDRLTVIPSL
ncbi:MAG: hypothetical protein KAQ97_06845 [Candidatus Fermentibacteraceae bacterium]|nr:hypothetical protein [Candidatus Fermentibacteraceae bacterium]